MSVSVLSDTFHALISIITLSLLSDIPGVLTWPSLCALQSVSAPRSAAFPPCPDKSLPLPSPERECASVGRFPYVS